MTISPAPHPMTAQARKTAQEPTEVTPPPNPHLAHHFHSMQQQHEAAKLGMWLFLATEFLLFGGLFVLYGVLRSTQPELFLWGSQFLDTTLGAVNTGVLILSSFTMAMAVRCVQLNQRRGLLIFLLLTLAGGAGFLGIKYVEYKEKFATNTVWGLTLYEPPGQRQGAPIGDEEPTPAPPAPVILAADPVRGQAIWMSTCTACHGDGGEGVRGQAFDIRDSTFIRERDDDELAAFIRTGRMGFDKSSRTGIQMPAKGGNPLLKDEDLRHVVAHMRTFMLDATAEDPVADDEQEAPGVSDAAAPAPPVPAAPRRTRTVIPRAPAGPAGTIDPDERRAAAMSAQRSAKPDPRTDPNRPPNAHLFFGLYFIMTGLHGFHVIAGMVVIGAISWLSFRGRFSSANYAAVENTGLYWHVVDLIWIFLFPLLYLIH